MIYPYVKSNGVYHCPDDSGGLTASPAGTTGNYKPAPVGVTTTDTTNFDQNWGSYAINATGFDEADYLRGPGNTNQSLNTLNSPATTIWVTDGDGGYSNASHRNGDLQIRTIGGYKGISGANAPTGNNQDNHFSVARHGAPDLCNTLFCDGHVKSMRLDAMMVKNAANEYYMWDVKGE